MKKRIIVASIFMLCMMLLSSTMVFAITDLPQLLDESQHVFTFEELAYIYNEDTTASSNQLSASSNATLADRTNRKVTRVDATTDENGLTEYFMVQYADGKLLTRTTSGTTLFTDEYDDSTIQNQIKLYTNGYGAIIYCQEIPDTDYHWYRQNPDGTWSHKMGRTEVTNLDASGILILDPQNCDRNYEDTSGCNYSTFVGYFYVSSMD